MPPPPDHATAGSPLLRVSDAVLLLACLVGAGTVSLFLGQDANWDLQNYHYYNAWAWWHGRNFTWDVAAAQLQTYHNALLDLPFYAMVAAGWSPRSIAVALAMPTGIAAFFLAKLLAQLFCDLPDSDRRIAVVTAFAIGVTPAIGVGVIGSTMNEWPLVALMMPGLWLVVRALVRSRGGAIGRVTLVVAGVLFGLASGFKLTAATFAVGLCAAILLRGPYDLPALRRAFGEAFVFGLGVLAGTAVTLGPWAWALWVHFQNPVFPYGNVWFKSPWWGEYPVIVRRYGPHNLGAWLRFPFELLGPGTFFVTEVPYQDARMPVTYGLGIVAGAAWLSLRVRGKAAMPVPAHLGVSRAWQLVTAFFMVSFLLWTAQHSVYRYLIVLDMLTGALIVTMLFRILRPGLAAGVAIVAAVALIATTRHADWWRVDFGPQWFDVRVPAVEPNALVLLNGDGPISYVLPFLPADARFLGVNNSINDPARRTRMAETVARVIREHRGPVYSLTFPAKASADALRAHGLARVDGSCADVRTNMLTSPIELCRLAPVAQP